jgi:hypothetical protein
LIGLTAVGCKSKDEDPFEKWTASGMYKNYVPPSAQSVARGKGILTYTTTQQGTLYLLDLSDQVQIENTTKPRLVASGLVLPGRKLVFDPSTGEISAEGRKPLKLTNVNPSHEHELRFDPSKQEN